MVNEAIAKSLDDRQLSEDEIAALFSAPLFSAESAMIQAAARRKSEKACGGLAEVHGQIGLNLSPCPRNCRFCAFAIANGVFTDDFELPAEEVISRVREFESAGANAVFLMTTAHHPFEKFLEVSQEVRRCVKPDTVLVANIGDFTKKEAQRLKEAGFAGVYHAVRMGEGRDTSIAPETRLETFRNAKEAGLVLGTCVEPVGNEHCVEELVEKTVITREAKPSYSGAMRRIPIPNTDLAQHGIVSEARMAHIVAVVRLALGYDIPGHCTHEPNVIGAAAGAGLAWAETGSNPRDTEGETEGKRGMSVDDCRRVFSEAQWEVLEGPSRLYSNSH